MTHGRHAVRHALLGCRFAFASLALFGTSPHAAAPLEAPRSGAESNPEPSQSSHQVKLLVLDIELLGDLSDPSLAAEHAQRIRKTSDELRAALAGTQLYEIVERAPAREMIDRLSSVQYLHKCNGCEIDIALELGAEQVLVAWVHRVSNLILSLTYEIREVPSGTPIRRKSFDFRGDNDQGWSRAAAYMVRDLEESAND